LPEDEAWCLDQPQAEAMRGGRVELGGGQVVAGQPVSGVQEIANVAEP
jgi:hypothetical protein